MSILPTLNTTPIESIDELVASFHKAAKAPDAVRIGFEHEKLLFRRADFAPVPYEGAAGIRAVLEELAATGRWTPMMEGDILIGLERATPAGPAVISLEPGGQFEYAAPPADDLHAMVADLEAHRAELRDVLLPLGLGALSAGYQPLAAREAFPFMPKGRYRVMHEKMLKSGTRGLDMMQGTAAAQVSLDFISEEDMAKKMRVAQALQPVATAMFAASPFSGGMLNGFLTERGDIWSDVDNTRAGLIRAALEPGFTFAAYVDYVLAVPMYFIWRDEAYLDVGGMTFGAYLRNGFGPHRATWHDWALHLSTIFTDVRLKNFIEMRGADAVPADLLPSLAAFWVGIFYDRAALDGALALVESWPADDVIALRAAVPAHGLDAEFGGRDLIEIAQRATTLALQGLRRRARRLDGGMADETRYLEPLRLVAESGRSPAHDWRDAYEGRWGGDVRFLFKESYI